MGVASKMYGGSKQDLGRSTQGLCVCVCGCVVWMCFLLVRASGTLEHWTVVLVLHLGNEINEYFQKAQSTIKNKKQKVKSKNEK